MEINETKNRKTIEKLMKPNLCSLKNKINKIDKQI